MALQVWLPLNGDLHNQGISSVTVSNSGATVSNNGKIGKCYSFANSNYLSLNTIPYSKLTNCSVCFWICLDAGDESWLPCTGQTTSYYFLATQNNTGTFYHQNVGSNTKTIYRDGVIGTTPLPAGSWHHYCITGLDLSGWSTFLVNLYGSTSGGWNFTGRMNDFRIYDHCLSPKEVKEISKGLVLHYKLDDPYVEGTTNISRQPAYSSTIPDTYYWDSSKHQGAVSVSNWSIGYNSGVTSPSIGYHACWKMIDGIPTMVMVDRNSEVNLAHRWLGISGGVSGTDIPSNTQYTVSFDAKSDVANKIMSSGLYYRQSSSGSYNFHDGCPQFALTTDWKRYSYTYTTGTVNNISAIYVYGHNGSTEGTVYVRNLQVEFKDHATPYTVSSRQGNLVTGLRAGGRTSIVNNQVVTSGVDGDTYFSIAISESIVVGDKYRISCQAEMPSGTYWNFPLGQQGNTSLTWRLEPGYNTYTFTANDINWDAFGKLTLFMDDSSGTARTSGTQCKFYDFVLQKLTPIYDSSGYGRNGTMTSTGEFISVDNSARYNKALYFSNSDCAIGIGELADCVPDGIFTFNMWFRRNTGVWSTKSWETLIGGSSFEIESKRGSSPTLVAYNWGESTSGGQEYELDKWNMVTMVRTTSDTKFYLNGVLWHTGNVGSIGTGRGFFIGAWPNTEGVPTQNYRGNLSDARIYSTALSADDIKELYDTSAIIYNDGTIAAREFDEGGNNLAINVERYRIQKSFAGGLSAYTQSNCSCTLTDDGYRIYRGPNLTVANNGNTMWGGFVINNGDNTFNFQKGHTYMIQFEIKGKTSNAVADIYWTNNVGWGGGGLNPSPSEQVIANPVTANYNSSEWKTFTYKWTINDDVYKVCTSSYSSFVQGETYLSYKGFKYGFGYTSTGELGTDLYIRNIRMYDVTNQTPIDITKTGKIDANNITEEALPAEMTMGGVVGREIIEI